MADETPKSDKPQTTWEKLTQTTPVVLTVLATILAGMSSSEMTRSMYYRSLAAQNQSKAGDQWAFFQAKRIRGTSLETTGVLLRGLARPDAFDADALQSALAALDQLPLGVKAKKPLDALKKLLAEPGGRAALDALGKGQLPKVEDAKTEGDEPIQKVLEAVRRHQTEKETADIVKPLSVEQIEGAIRLAEQNADAFEKAGEPVSGVVKSLRGALGELGAAARRGPANEERQKAEALTAATETAITDYDAKRYRVEAAYNQKIAELYEVRVRRSGYDSDVHRERSRNFFFSMLLAQGGVTVAALALAKQRKSLFWMFAAVAGFASIAFTGFTYFRMT